MSAIIFLIKKKKFKIYSIKMKINIKISNKNQ